MNLPIFCESLQTDGEEWILIAFPGQILKVGINSTLYLLKEIPNCVESNEVDVDCSFQLTAKVSNNCQSKKLFR